MARTVQTARKQTGGKAPRKTITNNASKSKRGSSNKSKSKTRSVAPKKKLSVSKKPTTNKSKRGSGSKSKTGNVAPKKKLSVSKKPTTNKSKSSTNASKNVSQQSLLNKIQHMEQQMAQQMAQMAQMLKLLQNNNVETKIKTKRKQKTKRSPKNKVVKSKSKPKTVKAKVVKPKVVKPKVVKPKVIEGQVVTGDIVKAKIKTKFPTSIDGLGIRTSGLLDQLIKKKRGIAYAVVNDNIIGDNYTRTKSKPKPAKPLSLRYKHDVSKFNRILKKLQHINQSSTITVRNNRRKISVNSLNVRHKGTDVYFTHNNVKLSQHNSVHINIDPFKVDVSFQLPNENNSKYSLDLVLKILSNVEIILFNKNALKQRTAALKIKNLLNRIDRINSSVYINNELTVSLAHKRGYLNRSPTKKRRLRKVTRRRTVSKKPVSKKPASKKPVSKKPVSKKPTDVRGRLIKKMKIKK